MAECPRGTSAYGLGDLMPALRSRVVALVILLCVGCLGSGTAVAALPTADSSAPSVATLSLGAGYSCVLTSDRRVRCWGSNALSTLGSPTQGAWTRAAVDAVGMTDVRQVSAGMHTCAVKLDGSVWCWGIDEFATENGMTDAGSKEPKQVAGVAQAMQVSAAGYEHTCALIADGSVTCWGEGRYGQLGNGDTPVSSGPVKVLGIETAVQVATADKRSCALLADRTVRCWGLNGGLLGDGGVTPSAEPLLVRGITDATQISLGFGHSCARMGDGSVRCWGANPFGQLGDGSTKDSPVPVVVSGIRNAVQVAAGEYHSCALLADSTISCWGFGSSGQLGNGKSTDQLVPTPVLKISTATQVSLGWGTSCALLKDRTVLCWGNNLFGLTDANEMFVSTPTVVTQIFSAARPTPNPTAVPTYRPTPTPTPSRTVGVIRTTSVGMPRAGKSCPAFFHKATVRLGGPGKFSYLKCLKRSGQWVWVKAAAPTPMVRP